MPESILKKQSRDAKVLKELKERRDKDKKERAEKRKVALGNAEKYHKEYTNAERKIVDEKRKAKAAGNIFVEAEPKVAFVIRIRG